MDVGDQLIVQSVFRGRNGQLKNPTTVVGKIIEPDGNGVALGFINPSVGVFEATFTITKKGDHYVRVEGSGDVVAAGERHFKVKQPKVVIA